MNWGIKLLIPAFILLCCQNTNANWTKQNSGTLAWLYSIYFVSQNDGWVVGSGGTFLATTDGGKSWRQAKKFTADNIRDVYFTNRQTGWLLCEGDLYAARNDSPSYLLKTTDGGISWEKINFPNSKERIARIFFDTNGKGFASGENGTLWMMQTDPRIWKRIALPVRNLMLAGTFTDNLNGFLVGGGGTILFTEDGGVNWNRMMTPEIAKTRLNAIFFIDQKTGWTIGAEGRIYFTDNGGKVWRAQNSNVSENISDVFFVNASEGFAVGDNGTILHTTTSGKIWDTESTDFKYKLEKVFFINKRGFAVGFGGTILNYN